MIYVITTSKQNILFKKKLEGRGGGAKSFVFVSTFSHHISKFFQDYYY